MPLYSFQCESCGWQKDRIFRASERPAQVDCGECDQKAEYRISVSKSQSDTVRYTTNYSTEKRGLALHDFKCKGCSHVFEEIVDVSAGQSIQDSFECPKCSSSDSSWVPSVQIDRFSEQFPKYDRGLGCWLKSKAHRRQVCKERGLEPVEGDYDADKIFSEFDSRREKEETEYNEYVDRLDNAPEFAEYRRAVNQDRH